MCLLLVANGVHSHYRWLIAANRDEFYARPSRAAGFWPQHPNLLAGEDLRQHGTWLGLTRQGRFAAITNYYESPSERRLNRAAKSRGHLVRDFLVGTESCETFAERCQNQAQEYHGYSLIVGDGTRCLCVSNRDDRVRKLEPGLYGLSNHLLDSPWPKVNDAKQALNDCLSEPDPTESIFRLLSRTADKDPDSPDTNPDTEQYRRAIFVRMRNYGTRSSTVILISETGRVQMEERSYPGVSHPADHYRRVCYRFRIRAKPGL